MKTSPRTAAALVRAAKVVRQQREPLDRKLTVMMSKSERAALELTAASNGETVNQMIRRLIREAGKRLA